MTNVQRPQVLVLSQNDISVEKLRRHLPLHGQGENDVEFFTDKSRPSDLVVVVNYVPYDLEVISRKNNVWVWDNEPLVRHKHPRAFSKVFTHLDPRVDKRRIVAPPVLDWWIDKTFDDLADLEPPKKTDEISAVISTKSWKGGHQKRRDFVTLLERKMPELDLYGKGRPRELADKWDGLAKYRYSVAIENTSKPDYWTEKISDCLLSYTVPFYYGATNIDDYFPPGSYVWLPIDEPEKAVEIIRKTLQDDDWNGRLPALREARRRVLYEYSLFGQVTAQIEHNRAQIFSGSRTRVVVQGRRSAPGGWIRGIGLWGNVKARVQRGARRKARSRVNYS